MAKTKAKYKKPTTKQQVKPAPQSKPSSGNKIMNVLKAAAPIAANFLPGPLSGIAKTLLSTLNDDEWFGGYDAGGVPLTTPLFSTQYPDSLAYNEVHNMAEFVIDDINAPAGIPSWLSFDNWQSVIAGFCFPEIRDRVNNILIATTDQYVQYVRDAAMYLSMYYSLKRNLALWSKPPETNPNIFLNWRPISGVAAGGLELSAIAGLALILEQMHAFITQSVFLPFAFTEYIRWRFGTTFQSNPSSGAGLILYTPIPISVGRTIDQINDAVQTVQNRLGALMIAGADFRQALKGHQRDLSIEEMHYDEKEFCLRANLSVNSPDSVDPASSEAAILVMDTRVASSPLIQATLISTGSTAIVPVEHVFAYAYLASANQVIRTTLDPQVIAADAPVSALLNIITAVKSLDLYNTGISALSPSHQTEIAPLAMNWVLLRPEQTRAVQIVTLQNLLRFDYLRLEHTQHSLTTEFDVAIRERG